MKAGLGHTAAVCLEHKLPTQPTYTLTLTLIPIEYWQRINSVNNT